MMRRKLLLLPVMLTMPLLLAAAPAQQLSEFEFQWWHGVLLVTCVMLPLFLLIVALSFRQAPDPEALLEARQQEEEELARARAAAEKPDESGAPEATADSAAGAGTESAPDDLTKIEGIGPKTMEVLAKAGIVTFGELAETEVERLNEILQAAGSRFGLSDPTTWPEQAALAAAGDWAALEELQDKLSGGRREE